MFETWFEDADITIAIEWVKGLPFAHLALRKWSPTIAYRLIDLKQKLCADLHKRGYNYLSVYNPIPDRKWYKLVKLLGFTEHYLFNNDDVFFTSTRPCL